MTIKLQWFVLPAYWREMFARYNPSKVMIPDKGFFDTIQFRTGEFEALSKQLVDDKVLACIFVCENGRYEIDVQRDDPYQTTQIDCKKPIDKSIDKPMSEIRKAFYRQIADKEYKKRTRGI